MAREEGEWQGRKGSGRGGRGVAGEEGGWQGRKGSGRGGRGVAGEEGEKLQLNLLSLLHAVSRVILMQFGCCVHSN